MVLTKRVLLSEDASITHHINNDNSSNVTWQNESTGTVGVCVCVCQIFAIFHIFLSLKTESKKASGGLSISGSDKMADTEGKGKHLHRHVALMWRKEP